MELLLSPVAFQYFKQLLFGHLLGGDGKIQKVIGKRHTDIDHRCASDFQTVE